MSVVERAFAQHLDGTWAGTAAVRHTSRARSRRARVGQPCLVVDGLAPGQGTDRLLGVPVVVQVRGRRRDCVSAWERDSADPRELLRWCLDQLGVDPGTGELFALAAETVGTLERGGDLAAIGTPTPTARHAAAAPSDTAAAARPGGSGEGQVPVAWDAPGGECGVGAPDLAGRVAGASVVLSLVEALTGLSSRLDGALLGVVGDLAVRNGRILLAVKGVSVPQELTKDQRKRWRARSKSVTRREIAAATGWGQGESTDLVALATAPAAVAGPVRASLSAGVTSWRLARRFFREFAHHPHEDAADVADYLFGTDPDRVCTDRLDPDGNLKTGPWEHLLFYRAVEAEAARLAGCDPAAAAAARRHAHEGRDLRVTVHQDGTGSLTVHGTATQVAAVADRIERAARAARARGDTRPLAHLRADIAMSLLLHSALALPDRPPPEAEETVRTAWTEQVAAVLAALPAAVLNVIVPFDALVHSPHRPLFGHGSDVDDDRAPGDRGDSDVGHDRSAGARGDAVDEPSSRGAQPGRGGEVAGVGWVTGAFPQFLTPDAVRELALAPGTSLYRLLMDPADGRCVERSRAAYAPDAQMRAQVHAADVTCRAPGCVRHATYTQLDHVIPYGTPDGITAETNLMSADAGHHDAKTRGDWTAVLAANRDVTWTSLLGRIYRTRAHDYRQYSTLYRAALNRVHEQTQNAVTELDTDPVQALADAVDQAIYRALSYRGPARSLRAGDDHPDTDVDPAYHGWDIITLTHTTPDGQRRWNPHPDTVQAERDAQRDATADQRANASERDTRQPGARTPGWRHDPHQDPPPF